MRNKILLFIMLLFVIKAKAQWTTNTSVNTSFLTGNSFNDPHIVNDGSGNYYISSRPAFGRGFYGVGMQRVSHDGVLQWGSAGIFVSKEDKNSSFTTVYSLAADHDGNAVVAYSDYRNGNPNIYVNKIDADGHQLWGKSGIELSVATNQDFDPQILALGDGSVIVAWLNSDVSGLYLQRISANGDKMWGDNGILYYQSTATLKFLDWPHLVLSDDHTFFLVFERANASAFGSEQNLCVQKFNLNGGTVWTDEKVILSQSTLGEFAQFFTIRDHKGGLLVTWLDDRNSGFGFNAFVQHVDASGNMLLTADGEDTYGVPGNQLAINDAASTIDEDGNIFTTFYNNNQLYVQKIDASGNLLWKTTGHLILNYPSFENSINYVDWRSDGEKHLLTFELDSSFLQDDFIGVLVSKNGYQQPGTARFPVSTLAGTKAYPCSSVGDGQAVYCWQNQNDGSVSGQNLARTEPDVSESMSTAIPAMEIYPNPSSGVLNISGIENNQATLSLRITNAIGQIVWSQSRPSSVQMQIDLSKFSNGSYFLQINNGSQVAEKPFVIAR
jgi:hypothetical protein